jgi:nicotinate-nucleotide pyrophosphorylase (carboxylating)
MIDHNQTRSIPTKPIHPDILALIQRALEEDIGTGDITSNSIIPKQALVQGRIFAKEEGVIAGLEVASEVARLWKSIKFNTAAIEGGLVKLNHGQVPVCPHC